jgi:hypothetical protein
LVSEKVPSGNILTTGRKIMEYTMSGVPQFDGQNGHRFEMWSIKMKTFLEAHGYDVWKLVVIGYTATKKPKTARNKELKRNNKIAMDFIWEGLCDSIREKVGKCSSIKEIWDKLHNLYFDKSPIKNPKNKEDERIEKEEICSSCQTDS